MSETVLKNAETSPKSLEQLAIELAELNPKPVTNFTPDNLDEVMEEFLEGRVKNPTAATYSKLDKMDFDERDENYRQILGEILSHPDVPSKHAHVYEDYIKRTLSINELMRQAVLYRQATTEELKQETKDRFIHLNHELYGQVDEDISRAMIKELLDDTALIDQPEIRQARSDFIKLLPPDLTHFEGQAIKLKPSQEAKELVARSVQLLYGNFLKHTDRLITALADEEKTAEKDLKLGPQAIAAIFQTIIDEELPDSGWRVVVEPANSIHVDATTKTIKVPETRMPASPDKLRGLVVHELGVHMVRSIIGERSDLIPMRFGLAGSGEAEEGIATIMESVLADDASRTGYQHYLTATLINRGMEFRDVFEIMRRYKILDAYLDNPEDKIKEHEKGAFKFMFRSIRGTNGLPWHVTLNYFNGTHKIWNYIETHLDDPDLITFLFMGKTDPTNPDHLWGALDAKGRVDK